MAAGPDPEMQGYWEERAQSASDPWAPVYEGKLDLSNYNFVTRRHTVMRLMRDEGRFERLLDVGCGTGDYAALAERHGSQYHGLDFSPAMVAAARKRNGALPCAGNFIVGSGEGLPYASASFDAAIAIGFIEYFRDPHLPLAEIRRVLRPGGIAVIQSFKDERLGKLYAFLRHPLRPLLRDRRANDLVERPTEWVDLKYGQAELDELLAQHGFRRKAHAFNHFYLLPGPVRRRFPSAHIGLSEAIGRAAPDLLRGMAVNYFGKYVLEARP
jgi:ubiquinone/menaquinone biosynthesis C-methylase UbiE